MALSYGPVDALTIGDIETPVPGPGEVLVKVEAAAINPLDIVLITGLVRDAMPVAHPFVPGLDAAGTVESVGEGVTEFRPGDPIVAFTFGSGGSLAQYVPATVGPGLVHRPADLDPASGAAIPVAGMTAAAAVSASRLGPTSTVLIVGATGGVGSFAVQLAKSAGAHVIATGTPHRAAGLRRLGADEVIDHTSADVLERTRELVPAGVDVVIDLVSRGDAVAASAAAVKDGGRLVSTNAHPGELARGVAAEHVGVEHGADQLDDLVRRAASGELVATIDSTYGFVDAVRAVTDFVGNSHFGKVVVTF
ncbi:NADP-dependent oxidoreductase [Nocardia transvalensis]|uniref:NADP-dependent oxidoreductase n=1 Tax=Nocardia transvalensis TaxID=37333 RepID=UPI001893FEA4|nr:NADP-dependent oxidoreductase [Nocardia transvalensis]MBF6328248.1 NADP-dependent oxidoreductase [Nocardia transvalensis]